MKQFELNLIRRTGEGFTDLKCYDKIEGDTLVEILHKFGFILIQVQKDIEKEIKMKTNDYDDIPF